MTHVGTLIDRISLPGRLILRVQDRRGRCLDVRVQDRHMEEAAAIWGGGTVRYRYRGGHPYFLSCREWWEGPRQQEAEA